MRILLVSSSARGHAIADALKRSPKNPELISICSSANPGVRELAEEQYVLIPLTDIDAIVAIAKKTKPEFAIIGPEDPIAAGIADALEEVGIPTVAPFRSLARIESSKGFTRNLLKKYGIDCSPQFRVYTKETMKEMNKFIVQELKENFVVKYDALKGGKGVKVSGEHFHSTEDGVAYAKLCIEECGQVVIEEKLIGCEFSLMSFVSGTQVIDMPAVQDHKRAYEGDEGPNTGGMGSYSDADHSLPFLKKSDLERAKEIQRLTIEALEKEFKRNDLPLPFIPSLKGGVPLYRGILYGGFMAVENGIKLIEYNCRFGDPEALNVLPILSSDFVAICESIVHGELTDDLVKFEQKATVCKYIVPEGYPENKDQKGMEVVFPKPSSSSLSPREYLPHRGRIKEGGSGEGGSSRIYLGDLEKKEKENAVLRDAPLCHTEETKAKRRSSRSATSGAPQDDIFFLGTSRAAGIVGIGTTIEEAEKIAQKLCKQVQGPVRFRSDIGTRELIEKRVALMKDLRS